jgi:hypothetical protein
MPITTNGSYIPCCNEFLAHWLQCNAVAIGGSLLVAPPGKPTVSWTQFDSLRTDLLAAQDAVQSAMNDAEIARGDIDLKKAVLLASFGEFTGIMEAYYQGTKFYNAKPLSPRISDGEDRFTGPLRDAASLWEKMNAAGPVPGVALPLVLSGGITQGAFATALGELVMAYREEKSAEQNATLERAERDKLQVTIYEVLKAYRLAVPPVLAQYPELVATLPRLTPEPGHTPEPVVAEGTFVAPSSSRVTHTASSEVTLSHYELEGCHGAVFREEDATFLGRHEPGEANEFTVQFGLAQPGTNASYKVYVVLTTGNRAGSDAVVVARPA